VRSREVTYEPRAVVEGVRAGCFPDLYAALGGKRPDHVITLEFHRRHPTLAR
jgi:hypothetical protein